MFGKSSLIFAVTILYINIISISSQCIPNQNCPYLQGNCVGNTCVCSYGYKTFFTQQGAEPIFCNYKQTNKWIPFFLELFFPTIGLFYLGRYFHAFIKLAVFIPLIWSGKEVSCLWGTLFFLFYFVDLFLLAFGVYSDGYGIPLI